MRHRAVFTAFSGLSAGLLAALFFGAAKPHFYLAADGFIGLNDAALKAGFILTGAKDGAAAYKSGGNGRAPAISLTFDAGRESAAKNEFTFNLKGKIRRDGDKIMVDREALEGILNVDIYSGESGLRVSAKKFPAHYWTGICCGLVAHAGGCASAIELGGNSREALVLSYNSGHRVFEFDFNMTTDGAVAAVHDWESYRGPMPSSQWKETLIYGSLTSMTIEDILDYMAVNKDMFIITDTKTFDPAAPETSAIIRAITVAAKYKDPSLGILNRIVPQIYNRPMYDIVVKEYGFPSIIYTLYESPDTDKEALDFVKKHSDIKAMTMMPWKANKQFVKDLNSAGKLVYLHTINDSDEIKAYKAEGVHGFYTDFAYPAQTGVAVRSAQAIRVNGSAKGDAPARLTAGVVPSILVGGEAYVFAADLPGYGFSTLYDDKARTLTITRDKDKKASPISKSNVETGVFNWVRTNIRAVIDGRKIENSYHINGHIAVPFSEILSLEGRG